jgi:hypothetical protein
VLERTRDAGIRSQFENTWRVGDALPFGLYDVGDSIVGRPKDGMSVALQNPALPHW